MTRESAGKMDQFQPNLFIGSEVRSGAVLARSCECLVI